MSGSTTTGAPLGYLDLADTSPLGQILTPISPGSISFEAIRQDLITWATSKPTGTAWTDWFETDDGTIIAEWIAGLATFRKLAETMRQREASMDFAQLESSVFELAFNRGLLVGPAAGPILTLGLTTPVGSRISVNVGDFIGMQGSYELYSLEGKPLQATDTLRVAVGHPNALVPNFSTLGPFSMFQVPLQDRYVARELESLIADGVSVPLVAEPVNIGGFSNVAVLRRMVPSQVRIYIGNGTLGWYNAETKTLQYKCLSYGTDVTASLLTTPQVVIDATLTSFVTSQSPSFDPDKETLRAIARYYPLDGRIVTDADYEALIRKNFGGVLYDVLAYNTDPNEELLLLPNSRYDSSQLAQIQAMVEGKRGLGIQVGYTVLSAQNGLTFNQTFRVPAASLSWDLQQQVNTAVANQVFRFARVPTTISAVSLATQLSAKLGVQFTPLNPAAQVTLGRTDFLSQLNIGLYAG